MLTHRNMLTAATSIIELPRERRGRRHPRRAAARVRLRPLPDDHGVRAWARASCSSARSRSRRRCSKLVVDGGRHRLSRRADDLRAARRDEDACASYDFSKIRYVTNTAAALPVEAHHDAARALPAGAHLLDVRPHRVQALHVPAARRTSTASRSSVGIAIPEHRAVDRRRRRRALGPERGRPARHPRRDRDERLLGEARGDREEAAAGAAAGRAGPLHRRSTAGSTTRATSTSSGAWTTSSSRAARRSRRRRSRTRS